MQVMDHDDLIASLVETCENTDRTRVARAFVASLRTKRFDLRSPLGSYAFHFNHPLHQLDGYRPDVGQNYLACRLCPFFNNQGSRQIPFDCCDSIHQGPWLGENYRNPAYALGDLMLFSNMKVPSPDKDDWQVFRELLQQVRELPDEARLTDLNMR